MYSLYIDDASEVTQRRVAEAIQRVALGEDVTDSITLRQRESTPAVSAKENGTHSSEKPSTDQQEENGNEHVSERTADGGETSASHDEDQHLNMQLLSRVRVLTLHLCAL